MNADEWIAANGAELGKDFGWERKLADNVLTRVRGLDFENFSTQTEPIDRNGTTRRIDFTITEPGVRIAIEVDGFDKDGSGPMKPWVHDRWARRQRDIVNAGWRMPRLPQLIGCSGC